MTKTLDQVLGADNEVAGLTASVEPAALHFNLLRVLRDKGVLTEADTYELLSSIRQAKEVLVDYGMAIIRMAAAVSSEPELAEDVPPFRRASTVSEALAGPVVFFGEVFPALPAEIAELQERYRILTEEAK